MTHKAISCSTRQWAACLVIALGAKGAAAHNQGAGAAGCVGATCPTSPKESVLLQRSVAHVIQHVESNSSADPSDYDCNGDGVPECGQWDYHLSMCKNQNWCGHFYKFPDGTLDQSCRCRKCRNPDWKGTAFADPTLLDPEGNEAPFDALVWGTYKNWADHLDTCAPWLMPKDDADLRALLKYAHNSGYKVRISGAGHSAPGVVTDGTDNRVLVVSLAEYSTYGAWEFGLRDMPDGGKRATVNAGWTQFHLFEKVRPLGYFVPAQTAGYFFQLGGITAQSVHGGSYLSGFVHSYATRMRVMSWDGSIKIIDDEDEMRYWRCSFGLLGIILGIEFQLEHREHLQMYTVEKQMKDWNADNFWHFIKQDAEANLPDNSTPKEGGHGNKKSWNGEYFIDFISDPAHPTMQVYAQKANESVDANFEGELGIPYGVAENYRDIKNRRVVDDWHGSMTWGEAARRDGAPPIKVAGVDVNDMLKAFKKLGLAKTMSKQAILNIPRLVRTLSKKVNDGFFLTQSPAALAAAYFVKPEHAFASMDFLRKVQLESLSSKEFVWNLPGEFRFINVQDSAVLQPVPPGIWFNTQMISFADLAENDQAWKRDFAKVEQNWVKKLGAKPHLGKLFGFETRPNGEVEPFADSYSCEIFSDDQKTKFNEYRKKQDPNDLFASGTGMKFLATCS